MITAGGLIFIAATTDDLIRAIDIDTGEVVWQDVLPAGGQATPMTYEVNGRQYLAIFAGGHHFMETKIGDYLVVYSLPTPGLQLHRNAGGVTSEMAARRSCAACASAAS